MDELRWTGRDVADGQPYDMPPDYRRLPDTALAGHIRSGAPTAHPAAREFHRRHLAAVLSYARLCGRDRAAGNRLAARS